MNCIRIGFGTVAPLHEQKLQACDVRTAGVIDTDPAKIKLAQEKGFRTCETYADAAALQPDFWDICTPNDQHLPVIESIIKVCPAASILVEKPIVNFDQLERLQQVLEGFRGKLVVNENYLSSQIADKIKELFFDKLKLTPKKVIVEMDKNRTQDFVKGRYIAATVLGYEGPHMITILQHLGACLAPKPGTVIKKRFEDIEIPQKLEKQGLVDIAYEVDAVTVNLFTSMKGDIKHRFDPHCPKNPPIPASDAATRYRIAAIEGENKEKEIITVVGFYEPITGFPRSQGAVSVLKDGKVIEQHAPIPDDTMGKHLQRAVTYFKGEAENPCSLEKGIETLHLVHAIDSD